MRTKPSVVLAVEVKMRGSRSRREREKYSKKKEATDITFFPLKLGNRRKQKLQCEVK